MTQESSQSRPDRGRAPRRDVRRNVASLLEAAKEVFASSGVSAPAKEITDRAGVGVGTLYRHFPKRSDLIVAVLQNEVNACVAAAETLARSLEPLPALEQWTGQFVGLVSTKQGLAEALHSPDPAYAGLPDALLTRLVPVVERMLERARHDGSVRSSISARELLVGIALLCQTVPGEPAALGRRLTTQLVSGLRTSPEN